MLEFASLPRISWQLRDVSLEQCTHLDVPRFPLNACPTTRDDVAPPALAHLAAAAAAAAIDAVEVGIAAHDTVDVTCVSN